MDDTILFRYSDELLPFKVNTAYPYEDADITIGKGFVCGKYCIIHKFTENFGGIIIGENVTIGDFVEIKAGVIIENNVDIEEGVKIGEGVVIKEGCWVRKEANLPPGSKYGANSIVESGDEGVVIWFDGEPVMGCYYDTKSKDVVKWYRDIFIVGNDTDFRFIDKDEKNLRELNACFDVLRIYTRERKKLYRR